MKKLILFIPACIILISCSKNKPHYEGGDSANDSQVAVTLSAPAQDQESVANDGNDKITAMDAFLPSPASANLKVIKTGDISFETSDVRQTRNNLVAETQKFNGYIANESESGYRNNQKNYVLTLRVPAQNFDLLLNAISSSMDRIDSKNIQVQDVTAEYVDTESRIKSKKALEQRYLQLLSKATKMSDMISIEGKLSEIREEIEGIEAQFLLMQKQVAFSTLTLTFYAKATVAETGLGFGYKASMALNGGWIFLQNLFFSLLTLWPAVLITPLGWIIYSRFLNKRKTRNATPI